MSKSIIELKEELASGKRTVKRTVSSGNGKATSSAVGKSDGSNSPERVRTEQDRATIDIRDGEPDAGVTRSIDIEQPTTHNDSISELGNDSFVDLGIGTVNNRGGSTSNSGRDSSGEFGSTVNSGRGSETSRTSEAFQTEADFGWGDNLRPIDIDIDSPTDNNQSPKRRGRQPGYSPKRKGGVSEEICVSLIGCVFGVATMLRGPHFAISQEQANVTGESLKKVLDRQAAKHPKVFEKLEEKIEIAELAINLCSLAAPGIAQEINNVTTYFNQRKPQPNGQTVNPVSPSFNGSVSTQTPVSNGVRPHNGGGWGIDPKPWEQA